MAEIRADEISRILREQIKGYGKQVEVAETGTVLSTGDGIARVYGLEGVMAGELVEFPKGLTGLVLNLDEDSVGVALMGDQEHLREGDVVKRTGPSAPAASPTSPSAPRSSGACWTRWESRWTARAPSPARSAARWRRRRPASSRASR